MRQKKARNTNKNQNSTIQHLRSKIKRSRRRVLPLAIGIVVILVPIIVSNVRKSREVKAEWWDDTWLYRKSSGIGDTGAAALTNYQIELETVDVDALNTDGKLQSDCDDIRFTDSHGTPLDYWIEIPKDTDGVPYPSSNFHHATGPGEFSSDP